MRTVAALLFLAVCAYMGAGLYEDLSFKVQTVRAETVSLTESARLFGIAVRREQQLCSPDALSLPENGRRYAAGTELCAFKDGSSLLSPAPCVFYETVDGFEHLSPEMLTPMSGKAFLALADAKSESPRNCVGRLVFDNVWFFAARIDRGSAPDAGTYCRLHFPDIGAECQALVWAVSQADGTEYVLLRINGGNDELFSLRQCEAELILDEYSGISVPKEAVRQDSDGNNYVNVLTDGLVETRTVDIIYTGSDFCLAELSYSWDALRAGELIVLQTENEGMVLG